MLGVEEETRSETWWGGFSRWFSVPQIGAPNCFSGIAASSASGLGQEVEVLSHAPPGLPFSLGASSQLSSRTVLSQLRVSIFS